MGPHSPAGRLSEGVSEEGQPVVPAGATLICPACVLAWTCSNSCMCLQGQTLVLSCMCAGMDFGMHIPGKRWCCPVRVLARDLAAAPVLYVGRLEICSSSRVPLWF